MTNKQMYGVVYNEGKTKEIVRVLPTYEMAIEEAAMFTLETGAEHTVYPVKPKKTETKIKE